MGDLAWLSKSSVTIAWCWYLQLKDGTLTGFTSHDQELIIRGVTYKAKSSFLPTSVDSTNSLSVDNLDVAGLLSDESIDPVDLMAGRYDFAQFEFFIIDWSNLTGDAIILRKGTLGRVTKEDNKFTVELRGMLEPYQQTKGPLYQRLCRAKFFDSKCTAGGVLPGRALLVSTVVTINGNTIVANISPENNTFTMGTLRITSGEDYDFEYEIRTQIGNTFTLFMPIAFKIRVGDTFLASPGCDKNFSTCRDRYMNQINFRGEPDIPGVDYITKYTKHEE